MYWDLLPRIKNAEQAGKESLLAPFSKADFAVAKILAEAGFVGEVQRKTLGKKQLLEVKIGKKKRLPADFKIVSKPSRHIYVKASDVRPVKRGYGLAVISTSRGIMGDKEARKQKVGGEYLFEIW